MTIFFFITIYKSSMKFYIIGAGWYGCYLTYKLLNDNHDVMLVDKEDSIMSQSSSKNQNRLHLGFHYMRSYKTRSECINGYNLFMSEFGCLNKVIKNNIYIIHKNSMLDFETCKHIINYEKIPAEFISDYSYDNFIFNKNSILGYIKCDEKQILFNDVILYFNEILKKNIFCNVTNLEEQITTFEPDYILNCTYGSLTNLFDTHLFDSSTYFQEWCISFIIQSNKKEEISITVIDGNFFSIYPYEQNLYTLTHVTYTPYRKGPINRIDNTITSKEAMSLYEKIIKDVKDIIINYDELFKYHGYFISNKLKKYSGSDDRSCNYHEVIANNTKVISFIGGKITGIFNAWDTLVEILE